MNDIERNAASISPSRVLWQALAASARSGSLPHPIRARNSGLEAAWRRWRDDPARVGAPDLADFRRRFDDNDDAVLAALRADPALVSSVTEIDGPHEALAAFASLASAALMFASQPSVLIEPTLALQHMLAHCDLGADIPIGLLRPPLPASFIRFGPALQQAAEPVQLKRAASSRIEGVYVFAPQRAPRVLTLAPVFGIAGQPLVGLAMLDMRIADESRPLADLIHQACAAYGAEHEAHFQSVATLCTKIFLYLSLAIAVYRHERRYSEAHAQLHRVGAKKAKRLTRQLDHFYDRLILGPAGMHGFERTSGTVSAHWRRGHFRMQPCGPRQSLRKLMFIAPTLVAGASKVPA